MDVDDGSNRMASGIDDGTARGGGGDTNQDATGPSPEPKPTGDGGDETRRNPLEEARGSKRQERNDDGDMNEDGMVTPPPTVRHKPRSATVSMQSDQDESNSGYSPTSPASSREAQVLSLIHI